MSCCVIIFIVIYMIEEKNFYLNTIRPIEKKYTIWCNLYNYLKLPIIKDNIDFYNKILTYYYRYLLTTKSIDKLFQDN